MKSQNVIGPIARLKKIRLYLAMTRKQFGDATGISQYTIRSWENGVKNFTTEGMKRITLALEKKINFYCPFEWLVSGVGPSPISLYEENKIIPEYTISIDLIQEKITNEIVIFKKNNKDAQVIKVFDHTFMPIAQIGDYVGILPVKIKDIEKNKNRLVCVELNRNFKFGLLMKTPKSFILSSLIDESDTRLSKKELTKIYRFIWLRTIF